jgi:hypothetical protein
LCHVYWCDSFISYVNWTDIIEKDHILKKKFLLVYFLNIDYKNQNRKNSRPAATMGSTSRRVPSLTCRPAIGGESWLLLGPKVSETREEHPSPSPSFSHTRRGNIRSISIPFIRSSSLLTAPTPIALGFHRRLASTRGNR